MVGASLKQMVDDCEGAKAAVLMGFDGIAIESFDPDASLDIKTISSDFSFVLTQVRKASEILEVGGLEEVSIHTESMVFVVRVLSEEHFFAIVMRPSGNFGKARFLMRIAAPSLRSQVA
jgi:predicted regulator of Ras-like GTPase activity (Roadblock/LC7/MglB family)